MPDEPSAPRGLHNLVVNRLGAAIAAGELAAETQIFPDELGERFDASRPVVREALRVLEAKGMVRPRPKTGTRVLPMVSWNLLDQDVIGWRVQGPDGPGLLRELMDLRTAIEPVAARRCAERADDEQVAALRQACDRMATAAAEGDHSAFTRADISFHELVLEGSGNSIFRSLSDPFAAFLHAREHLQTLPATVDSSVIDGHRQIVTAIEARDPDAAESLSRALIAATRDELEDTLDPSGA